MFPMARGTVLVLSVLIAGCASPRDGEDTGTPGRKAPALEASLRLDPEEVVLAERREVRVLFTVRNTTKRVQRLDFPTAQRLELIALAPDGRRIFLWSEDRLFDPKPSTVVINPRERVEYEATVPTRDMTAGSAYSMEVGLVGYPEVAATVNITPR